MPSGAEPRCRRLGGLLIHGYNAEYRMLSPTVELATGDPVFVVGCLVPVKPTALVGLLLFLIFAGVPPPVEI